MLRERSYLQTIKRRKLGNIDLFEHTNPPRIMCGERLKRERFREVKEEDDAKKCIILLENGFHSLIIISYFEEVLI